MKKTLKKFGIIILVTVIGLLTVAFDDNDNLIFNEDFNGTSLDGAKWELCPNLDRQGRSTWMDDMVSLSNGYLHLKFKRDAELGGKNQKTGRLPITGFAPEEYAHVQRIGQESCFRIHSDITKPELSFRR